MVQLRHDVVGLDASILSPPAVFEASGHLQNFSDPLVDCRGCGARHRADKLADPDACPDCGRTGAFTEARQFNLMFSTHAGPVADSAAEVFLRPETAQGRLRELHERAAHQPPPPAVRHRPDRQVVPQRDNARQLRLPHPRVRADGARVLRSARPGRPVVSLLVRGPDAVVPRPRHRRRPAAPAPPSGRRAEPLLLGHLRRGVPLPVGLGRTGGHRQPGELRPEPPRRMLRGADRVLRSGLRRPLRAPRHRARGRGHPGGHGLSDRGLPHRAGGRGRAHRVAPRPPPGPLPGGGAAPVPQ